MRIAVIGTGYVGLVTGACFAEMGNDVVCVDKDEAKLQQLHTGKIPIFEPGLEPLVRQTMESGVLSFTSDLPGAIAEAEYIVIAVGTPPLEDGGADLSHVLDVAGEIGRHLRQYAVIIDKSTVPVGTAEKVRARVEAELATRGEEIPFDVVSNPEFLKEGAALTDFRRPDRIIVGVESERAKRMMTRLYDPFMMNHDRLLVMGIRDAEMTKYAANAMLATRISFINEIANLCDRLGVDVENVRKGIGSDQRIGYSFIYAGAGYGGSCFPKDVKALIHSAVDCGFDPQLLHAVEERNEAQKRVLFDKIHAHFGGDVAGRHLGLWGLAFKPNTDDVREAVSVVLIRQLVEAGARVTAYDPVALESVRMYLDPAWLEDGRVTLTGYKYDALKGADAMVLVTEWKLFRQPDFTAILELLKSPVIFDGRNQYDPALMRDMGFVYYGIGRSSEPFAAPRKG